MRPFKLEELLAISRLPGGNVNDWLVAAEDSLSFLRENALNDEIVIYASTQSVLIHGVLGLVRKLNQESIAELHHRNAPATDDSWRIERVWGRWERASYIFGAAPSFHFRRT